MHSFQYTPYALPLAIAAILSALLTFTMWERRHTPGATPAAVLLFALFVWSAGYSLEFLGADLPTKLFWAKIQYFGIVTLPVALLLFALVDESVQRFTPGRHSDLVDYATDLLGGLLVLILLRARYAFRTRG